jgi:TolB-like protein/tRNA A-37 threonylcarbamoyl transferase component Bud32/Tfp pilus assembly protein PilF
MIGEHLGHFCITAKIGSGGMGVVYRARDEQLHRDVAIKVLPASAFRDTAARSRLLREARTASQLNHPYICTVYEVGEDDGQAYIAMELVEGRSLSDRLSDGPLVPDEALRLAVQLADAMAHAHERGVVHADLKSANIVVTPGGRVKVLDFGLAKRVTQDAIVDGTTQAVVTAPGTIPGTLAYMAPEQLRGDAATTRSDVWSLGVVIHEMVAGSRPFRGQTSFELSSAILNDAPAPLEHTVPLGLRTVVEQCLDKEPGRRYRDAGDMRAALESQPDTVGQEAGLRDRWPGRRMAWTVALMALAVATGVLVSLNVEGLRERLRGGPGGPRIRSLAVLPLDDLSGDAEQEYFAAGTHETLITDLARIRALRVTARSSVLRYKGTQKPPSEIARELNVDAVLTGSVARVGDRVRITAQLIDASTDGYLWADRYDRAVGDVLSLQNEIVMAIIREVRLQLTPEEQARFARARPVNPAAYEAYLKGMFYLNQVTPEGTKKGLALLHEAVEKDPTNALPYAHLAIGYATLGHGPSPPPDAFARARAAALKAVEIDDSVAQAHQVLAQLTMYDDRSWDWPAAKRGLQRAIELNPSLPDSHAHYAWYVVLFDHWEEGFASMRRAQEVDPLAPLWPAWQGSLYWWIGRHDEAIRECQKSLELNPNFPTALSIKGRAYSDKGMHEEAIAAQEKATALNRSYLWGLGYAYARAGRRGDAVRIAMEYKGSPGDGYESATIYAALGDKEGALRELEAASERGEISPWMRNLHVFAPLRDDPRFKDLARRMKLPI